MIGIESWLYLPFDDAPGAAVIPHGMDLVDRDVQGIALFQHFQLSIYPYGELTGDNGKIFRLAWVVMRGRLFGMRIEAGFHFQQPSAGFFGRLHKPDALPGFGIEDGLVLERHFIG